MIRPASESDYPGMDALQRASGRALCAGWYEPEAIEAWLGQPKPERYTRGAAAGDQYFLDFEGECLVCFGGINMGDACIRALFVHPEYAGRGLASEMMTFMLDRLRGAGLRQVCVESSLNAQGFYRRFGFVEAARDRMELGNGLTMESVLMQATLTG